MNVALVAKRFQFKAICMMANLEVLASFGFHSRIKIAHIGVRDIENPSRRRSISGRHRGTNQTLIHSYLSEVGLLK